MYRFIFIFILYLEDTAIIYGLEKEIGNDQIELDNQILKLNNKIKRIALAETDAYLEGLNDSSCVENITVLHNHFMDVLAHYKPFKVTWEDYNPLKNFKVDPKNYGEKASILKAMRHTARELKRILAQIQDNETNCISTNYNFSNYEYKTYPVYTYKYSDYYSPLLFGASAWGLWSGWNAWNGWGSYHNWHRLHNQYRHRYHMHFRHHRHHRARHHHGHHHGHHR